MEKSSLGIILPGNPECIQRHSLWLDVYTIVCQYGGLPSFAIGAILMFVGFFGRANLLIIGVGMVLCSLILIASAQLWEEKVRCLYCKHFLTLKRISDNQFRGSNEYTISRQVHDNNSGVVFDLSGNSAFYTDISSRTEYGKEVTEHYTYNLRCSCCGAVIKVQTSKTTKNY